jgi:uncharacterized membrane protein YkgB
VGILVLGMVTHFFPERWFQALQGWFIRSGFVVQALVLIAVAIVLRRMASTDAVPFVYFQF